MFRGLAFETSRDEGETIDCHIVPYQIQTERDASRHVATSGNSETQVFSPRITAGHGTDPLWLSWAIMAKPDIVYSPRSDVAVMWLSVAPDQ